MADDQTQQTVRSEQAAHFIANFELKTAPEALMDIAETAFIDTIGVMLAGSCEPVSRLTTEMAAADEAAPVSAIVGSKVRTSVQNAALANGAATQALDFDLSFISGQSAAAVIPGLLPLAESLGSNGRELIAAYIVGCEVCGRIVRSFPGLSSQGGWHGAGVAGPIAAAAACARLMGAETKTLSAIIGIAGSTAAGLGANFGTMTKPFHAGLAARSGITAAFLGSRGFTSSTIALEGHQGFFESYARGLEWDTTVFDTLGEKYDLLDPGYKIKPFACGGLLHTAIEAALNLRDAALPRLDQITAIKIGAGKHAANRVIDDYPWSEDSSRFSLKYLIPYALIHGAPNVDTFKDSAIDDHAVRAFTTRVSSSVDPEFADIQGSGYSPSRVRIEFKGGDRLEEVVHEARGSKDNPMSAMAIKQKFSNCATRRLDDDSVSELYEFLQNLRHQENLENLWQLLTPSD